MRPVALAGITKSGERTMRVFGTDYDGVIINIEPEKAKAFGELLADKWSVGSVEATEFWKKTGGSGRRSKFDYFYRQRFGKPISDEIYQQVGGEYSRLLKSAFYPKTRLLPYASENLQYAKANFDYMFISSGVPMDEINELATLNGVADYFDVVLGTSSEYPSKREHFRKIIGEKKPEQMVFLADGLEDMRAAREFEVTAIGVTTNRQENELWEAGATYVTDLAGVVNVLKSL